MNNLLFFQSTTISDLLNGINDALFGAINALAGRSYVLDSLIAVPAYHHFVGAAVLGGCLFYAWAGDAKPEVILGRRRVLLIAVLASFFAFAATATISQKVFSPSPLVLSQKTYQLEGDQLVVGQHSKYRVPLDEESQKAFKALKAGEIAQADINSFPGGRAALYVALAVGILLASRSLGLMALGWTILATFGTRIVTGLNSPFDIVFGFGIGAGVTLVLYFAADKLGRRHLDTVVGWTFKNNGISAAILFVYLVDALNMFRGFRGLLSVLTELGKQIIRG